MSLVLRIAPRVQKHPDLYVSDTGQARYATMAPSQRQLPPNVL